MRAEDIRRWIDAHRAGEARERAETRAAGPSPDSAIAAALGLVALAGRLRGWPLPEDEVSRREDAIAWARWARVRAALLARGHAA